MPENGRIAQRATDDGFRRVGNRVEIVHDFSDRIPSLRRRRGGSYRPSVFVVAKRTRVIVRGGCARHFARFLEKSFVGEKFIVMR